MIAVREKDVRSISWKSKKSLEKLIDHMLLLLKFLESPFAFKIQHLNTFSLRVFNYLLQLSTFSYNLCWQPTCQCLCLVFSFSDSPERPDIFDQFLFLGKFPDLLEALEYPWSSHFEWLCLVAPSMKINLIKLFYNILNVTFC